MKQFWHNLRKYPGCDPEGLNKTTEVSNQDTRDLNPEPLIRSSNAIHSTVTSDATSSSDYGNEPSRSTKESKVVDQLGDYKLLKDVINETS
jgi:hypothetical protein